MGSNATLGPMIDQENTSYRRILRIALPMVVQGLIFAAMLLTDRIFVSHYDLVSFAAVGTAGDLALAIGFFFNGTIAFANDMVAQYYGAERKNMLASPVWAGLFLALVFGAFMIITLPLSREFFALPFFDHSELLVQEEKTYFTYMVFMQAIGLIQFSLVAFFIGRGKTLFSMIVAIAGNLVNIVMDYFLIFGNGIFPEMGIAGAGLASVLGVITSVTLAIIFFLFASREFKGILRPRFEPDIIKRMLKFGVPAGLKLGLEATGYAFLLIALGKFGDATVAAAGIGYGLQNFVYMPVVSMATAGAIVVAQERGANRLHNLNIIVRRVLILTVSYASIMLLIFVLVPDFLIALYGSGEEHLDLELLDETKRIARYFLMITGLWLIPDAFFNVYMQALKALGDGRYLSSRIAVTVLFTMVLPPLILMNFTGEWVQYAIYLTAVIYVVVLWVLFNARYRSGKWKGHKVID